MKLASYRLDGEDTFGAVVGDGVVTLGGGKGRWRTLRDALAADALGELKAATVGKAADHKLAQVTFLPVIPNPEKILCVGINYRDHAAETGRDTMSESADFSAARQHAGRPRGRDDPPEGVDQFRLRGRADRDHRQGRPPHQGERRARPRRRLHLLRRRQRARLAEASRSPRARTSSAPARSAPGW